MSLPHAPNLLEQSTHPTDAPPPEHRTRIRRVLHIVRTGTIALGVMFLVLAWTTRSSDPNVLVALRDSVTVRSLWSLLRSPSITLEGERDDRITVLFLGMGGEGHDGPLLTDTMLLASVQPSTMRTTLVSIPRDLLVPLPNGSWQKANTINAYGETKTGAGAEAARDALAQLFHIAIPYVMRIDFDGFAGIIDAIGGVDIDVERTLDDPRYPIAGAETVEPYDARFTHLHIPAGRQHMDGALALKYARSRHAIGIEGSDFARARRQQRFLLAVRDGLVANGGFTNPRTLLALLDTWNAHVTTNLTPPELYQLASRLSVQANHAPAHLVFTDGPQGALDARIVDGAYVLQPKDGTFDHMRSMIADAFAGTIAPDHAEAVIASTPPSAPTIEVWNGTNINGLASRAAEALERDGFRVTMIRNAPIRSMTRTVVYRRGNVPETIAAPIAHRFDAESIATFPALPSATASTADILIILGTSSAERITTSPPPHAASGNTRAGEGNPA